MFPAGDRVDISGISKGKGFQGTIKRYGQKGGRETHGSMYHRRVGSMSANTNPAEYSRVKNCQDTWVLTRLLFRILTL
jgi:large subunit ribosomal protein L3